MKNTDILLSLSTYESFPGAIKDAMASGVLCVATPVGGVSELVIDGISGIVCESTQPEALVAGIRRALELDETRWQKIVEQARRVCRSELHPQRAANDLFHMYNLALSRKSKKYASALVGPGLATANVAATAVSPAAGLAAAIAAAQAPVDIEQVLLPVESASSAVRLSGSLSYMITPKRNFWSGLGVMIGTHMRSASGRLVLQVFSESGNLLRSASLDLGPIHDNSWGDFHFEPVRNAAGKCFLVKILLPERLGDTHVSLYENAPRENLYIRAVRKAVEPLRLHLRGRKLYFREWYKAQ